MNEKIIQNGLVYRVLKSLSSISIILAIFVITRQFPLNLFGFTGIPKFLVFFCFLSGIPLILKNLFLCRYKSVVLLSFLAIFLIGFHSLYSLFMASNPIGTLRFFLILILIILAYYLKLPEFVLNWFIFFAVIQSLFLIIFEIYLIFLASPSETVMVRHFFLENNIGDVYSYNGYFYRIQILGNPLIPFAFFVSLSLKKKNVIRGILFLGVLISANLAFYLATFLFLLGYFVIKSRNNFRLINNIIKVYFLVFISLYPALKYMHYILGKKHNSLAVRADQFNVLINDMTNSTLTTLLGRGLGNVIYVKTPLRDYSSYGYYFELQTIYVFNQLGVFALMYYIILMYVAYKLYRRDLFFIYLCYIIYAVTNPYILDSTHIIVILILNILQEKYYGKSLCNYNDV